LTVLSKRLAALEAHLAPMPSPYVIATYRRGDDGFDAALAEIIEEGRGKPGGITDQDEVFSISAIRGLGGQGEDLTIVRTIVDPKPEPSA
jgi:hypothetical protein